MSTGSGPRMLALYRDILRAHRAHLRPGLRRFGDQYVAYEFRQHKSAKPDFLPAFEEQWRTYLKTIKESTAGVVPEGPQGIDAQLNDEQKAQLKVPSRRARRAERHGTSASPRLAHHRLWLPDPRARALSPRNWRIRLRTCDACGGLRACADTDEPRGGATMPVAAQSTK